MTDPRPASRLVRRFAVASGLLLCFVPVGCLNGSYSPGGSGVTGTAETYESTPQFQPSLTLIDTSTNETIWSMDVPVGKQLVLQFAEDYNKSNPTRPALMKWKLMNRGETSGTLDNTTPAPDANNRLLDVKQARKPQAVTRPEPPVPSPAPAPAATPPAPKPPPAAPVAPKPKQ